MIFPALIFHNSKSIIFTVSVEYLAFSVYLHQMSVGDDGFLENCTSQFKIVISFLVSECEKPKTQTANNSPVLNNNNNNNDVDDNVDMMPTIRFATKLYIHIHIAIVCKRIQREKTRHGERESESERKIAIRQEQTFPRAYFYFNPLLFGCISISCLFR